MKARRNRAMKRLARGLRPRKLPPRLTSVLRKGLVLDNGCVLLAEFADAKQKADDAKSLREWSINHLHIDDYLSRSQSNRERQLSLGLSFGQELVELLRKNQEFGPFRVVVSIDADDEDPRLTSCTVRFYRKRRGEVVMSDNLEGYKLEAIQLTDIQ
jgi:hypothetical protein